MNYQKFINVTGSSDSFRKSVIESIMTTDMVGSVLRIHLACEQIVEAWICSSCNKDNFFYDVNGDRIIVDFFSKLKIARTLDLPKPLYEVLHKINTIRNGVAHNPDFKSIKQSFFESMAQQLDNFTVNSDYPISESCLDIFNENNEVKYRYKFNDIDIPDQYKLAIIFGNVLRKTCVLAKEKSD